MKKRNPKTRKRQQDSKFQREERRSYEESRKQPDTGVNDFSWYNRNPQLTVAAASLPFPYRPGMTVGSLIYDSNAPTLIGSRFTIPGVMALDWIPTLGQSATALDPASLAAKEIYAKVRSVYSGSLDADAPDFMIYLMALDSIFSYIGYWKRIYRILNAYSPSNYQTPDSILAAMGLEEEQATALRNNRAQLLYNINELIGMTRKFKCPAVFDVFNRHYWMNDNVYTDDASINSQFYLFNQKAFYQFYLEEIESGVHAGGLRAIRFVPSTIEAMYTFGKNLIDALASSEDGYTISGYLTRAYQDVPNFSVDDLMGSEVFTPMYEPSVLQQIENSCGVMPSELFMKTADTVENNIINSNNISQKPATNAIISTPTAPMGDTTTSDYWILKPALNIRSDQPSVIDVIEASRLAAYIDPNEMVSVKNYKVYCGTELPLRWRFYTNNLSSTFGRVASALVPGWAVEQSQRWVVADDSDSLSGVNTDAVLPLMFMSNFDWAPRIVVRMQKGNPATSADKFAEYLFWDVHNLTTFELDQMKQINRVCLLSEFNSFNV
nr:MAG TPA: capsid [Picobirnaviridae sp.]